MLLTSARTYIVFLWRASAYFRIFFWFCPTVFLEATEWEMSGHRRNIENADGHVRFIPAICCQIFIYFFFTKNKCSFEVIIIGFWFFSHPSICKGIACWGLNFTVFPREHWTIFLLTFIAIVNFKILHVF